MTKDEGKAEAPNAFSSVLNSRTTCFLDLSWKTGTGNRTVSTKQGKILGNLLHHLEIHKSMELDGIYSRILLVELAEALTKKLSIIYQQFCLTRQGPAGWNLANIMSIVKKGQKEDLGN